MRRTYSCTTWNTDFEIITGESIDQLKKRYDNLFDVLPLDKAPFVGGLTFEAEDGTIVIWVKGKEDFSTLAHECVHAAGKALKFKGVKADWDNDEPLTYLVGALMTAALR